MSQVLFATIAMLLLLSTPARAQEGVETKITGRIEHGRSAAEFEPTKVAVTLNVLEGITAVNQEAVMPDAAGNFSFTVMTSEMRTYFLSAEYQGARYSETRSAEELEEPVVIRVFDTTHDTSVLEFENYSVIVAGAVPGEGWIEVLERATVHNNSDKTLIPDPNANTPGMPSLLRFALPPGAYNLDVRSNLVGGDILEVDRGFALTTPVTPTHGEPHLFEFVYRLDHDLSAVDLSRVMRFGTNTFRYVAAVEVGRPISEELVDLGATELNGRFLRLLEGNDIQPGERVSLSITELTLPSVWSNLGELMGLWYVRLVVPATIIVVLIAAFASMLLKRRVLPAIGPNSDLEKAHTDLLELADALEQRRKSGKISTHRYELERDSLRQVLIDIRLRRHIAANGGLRA